LESDGLINLDKPPGPSSFAVVARLRRLLGVRKVGHAGTLDPLAGGVLLILLGRATRLSPYLLSLPKTYRIWVRLGQATTTYDAEGEPTWGADPSHVSLEALQEALSSMVGRILQTPPPYSAIKVRGRPAYSYVRAGQSVQLSPRWVEVRRIQVIRFRGPEVVLEVECGQGAYVRSLVHDLGVRLGCGAHVQALVRTAVGPFTIEQAVPLRQLEDASRSETWRAYLVPLEAALPHLPSLTLDGEEAMAVAHGRPIRRPGPGEGGWAQAHGPDGSLVAIMRWDGAAGLWRPKTVLLSPS
jgi:tRNA pseudouridine55 synthase